MIPHIENNLLDLAIQTQPSRTYALDTINGRVCGKTDGLGAVRQAIYLILNIERYEYLPYSWNYGAELAELIGLPKEYALSEIKRCITEALLQDSRITEVDGFNFSIEGKVVHASFTAHTIFGETEVETDVRI